MYGIGVWRNGSRTTLKMSGSIERGGSNPLTPTNYEELVEVVNMFDNQMLDAMAINIYVQAVTNFRLFGKHKR